jgi:hypothetical protein
MYILVIRNTQEKIINKFVTFYISYNMYILVIRNTQEKIINKYVTFLD